MFLHGGVICPAELLQLLPLVPFLLPALYAVKQRIKIFTR